MAEVKQRFKLKKSTKSKLMGVFAVLFLIIGCPGVIILAGDVACNQSIEEWLPIYPNSELVSLQYDFIRPRAIGTTSATYRTPDDAETVRQFYRDNNISIMNRGGGRGLASTQSSVEATEDGSLIFMYSECGT